MCTAVSTSKSSELCCLGAVLSAVLLCALLSGMLCHIVPPLGILLACKDKSASSSSVKIEALTFLRSALEANPPAVFAPHVEQLSTGGGLVRSETGVA